MQDVARKQRFRIAARVELWWNTDQEPRRADGRVLEIGSDAVVFCTLDRPPTRKPLTLSMAWPAPREDGSRVRLVVTGRLRKTSEHLFEMRIAGRRFDLSPNLTGATPVEAEPIHPAQTAA